ncbi:hypothetical protein MHH28_13580 [Paenibacillus sp. FSL K6-1217]|uniref:hypothetical protein n=1 Tax=Paenibacillus sp. FSL K6-1217 TaxID=2921466 RepID=UPI003252E554
MKNKKNINKLLITVLTFILIGGLSFTFYKSDASDSNNNVKMHFDLTESFDSIEGLEKSSSLIANIKVNSTKSFDYGNIVFTLSDVTVKKSYKGSIPSNSSISILETGGASEDGYNYNVEGRSTWRASEGYIA